MENKPVRPRGLIRRRPTYVPGDHSAASSARRRPFSREDLEFVFERIGELLREGLSREAEKILIEILGKYTHSPDDLANLRRLYSFTLETLGRYKESLAAISEYEDTEARQDLSFDTRVRVVTQLAISYNNLGDHPKAVTLLKMCREKAEAGHLGHLMGAVDIGLARVYRKLNECAICRDHAEKALVHLREHGNWLGMAEAYREMALSHHQEGSSEKSLEYFDLGIRIIGERSAPFMLGKLYSEMSGAYWFLRRSKEGIECLEKSITFFDRTEHILNSIMAYNNLGINLMQVGDWARAEEMIRRALELADETDHAHTAGILDSLGELYVLRGELDKAKDYLVQAIETARKKKREWYQAQAMRNLARCRLAGGDYSGALKKAIDTIKLCKEIGDKHYANMAGLIAAESALCQGDAGECENYLRTIEENDPSADFFVLGNIQRIRGLAALDEGDDEMAVHHFNRTLTIFEAADDAYHKALAHLLLGANLPPGRHRLAQKHLIIAGDIFRKLGVKHLVEAVAETEEQIKQEKPSAADKAAPKQKPSSAASQLLTVRLAEAVASRELLFRELVSVLQQESEAKKIIIAESGGKGLALRPFISHGYSVPESNELISKFEHSVSTKHEKSFSQTKDLAIFALKSSAAEPAYLLINPRSGAMLNDGTPLAPLLRVVELGMDVIALREKDKSVPVETESRSLASSSLMPGFIHSSTAMRALVDEVYKIRSSDVTVLVTGESGTGKELVARAIHTLSNRKDRVFVPFNCTAVPKELAEGHLFGYRKGAFTGAFTDSPGMIRAADGGTLFLDEVGDLPIDVQPKLLRFLQEGEVQPVGEKKPIKVDVRVIAATNMPLEEKVADGSFREDLYYRLNVIRLRVPPLRERRSEIPPIVNYYINHYSSRFNKRGISFTPQTIDLLMVCDWDGNVRQLCNEVQRIIARAEDGEVVTPNHLSPELQPQSKRISPFDDRGNLRLIQSGTNYAAAGPRGASKGTLEAAVVELEIRMISDALNRHNWNISHAASELGLTRRGLYMKISRYGISKAA